MIVTAPASTANLGPGFDVLGLALDLPMTLRAGAAAIGRDPEPDGHPAVRAYRAAGGGRGPISVETKIPPGKGLGFSGAAHVVGAAAGRLASTGGIDPADVLELAIELEGHADNAAASVHGGLTISSGDLTARVVPALELAVVVWIPDASTSTSSSRAALPRTVPLSDAVSNIGATAQLVAGLSVGDPDLLQATLRDRLHERHRLEHQPGTAAAIEAAIDAGALGAWVSGSGPTTAAFVRPGDARRVADALPDTGHTKVLDIDRTGLRWEE